MVLEVQEDLQRRTVEVGSTRYQENHQDRVLQQNHRGPRRPLDLSSLSVLLDLLALSVLLDLADLQYQPLLDLHRQKAQSVLRTPLAPSRLCN